MKKILIINSSAFTIGDIAISNCMVAQILKVIPGAQITIESGNPSVHKKYILNKNINVVQRLYDTQKLAYSSHYLSLSFLLKNFKVIFQYFLDSLELAFFVVFEKSPSKREIFKIIKEADIIISAGGDALTKHYGYFLRLYIFLILKLMKKKVVIYASTIGPFSGISKFFTIQCLKKLDLILVRDKKSYNFLIDNGLSIKIVKQVADCVILLDQKISLDTANCEIAFSAQVFGSTDIFLLENSSCSAQSASQVSQKLMPSTLFRNSRLDNKKNIENLLITKKTVGIFLKKFLYFRGEDMKKYFQKIKEVINNLDTLGYKIILFSANNADYEVGKNFIREFNLNNKVVNLMNYSSGECKEILSRLGLVISSRMHPAIFTTISGVPVIGISDESKMLEYFKIIDIPDLYLKPIDVDVFNLVNLVTKTIGNTEILKRLESGLVKARILASKNMEYFENWLLKKD